MSQNKIDYSSMRYTQEYFYPYFSNGRMTVSETYVALAMGFLDPVSLSPIRIIEYAGHLYCIDTRRLKIAKELERRRKVDILERLPVKYINRYDANDIDQYRNLVHNRLKAMKKKGLDGSSVKILSGGSYTCCYNPGSGNFLDDLERHIAKDHVSMDFQSFKQLNIYICNKCSQNAKLYIIKPPNKSNYRFMQICSCANNAAQQVDEMQKPWTDVCFKDICDKFLQLKQNSLSLKCSCENPYKERQADFYPQSIYHVSSPYSNQHFTEIRSNGFMNEYCLFLIGLCVMVIVSWIMFHFFSK